jgi:hypothetical protein
MVLELVTLALSNFIYGAIRTWDIQNLSKGEVSLKLFLSSSLNSAFWLLTIALGIKGVVVDGSFWHVIVFVLSSSLSAMFATYIQKIKSGKDQ